MDKQTKNPIDAWYRHREAVITKIDINQDIGFEPIFKNANICTDNAASIDSESNLYERFSRRNGFAKAKKNITASYNFV